jgi:hypothetical protein
MNDPKKIDPRVLDLVDDYLNGTLDESGVVELDRTLRADADARAYFVRYASLDTDLRLEMRARRAGRRALDALKPSRDESPISSSSISFPTSSPPTSFPSSSPHTSFPSFSPHTSFPSSSLGTWRAVATVLAASLLAVAGVWLFGRQEAARTPAVAWLVNAQNCQWAGAVNNATNGAGDLHAGKVLELVRGLAELRFQCGATAVVEGPAQIELLSATRVRLVRGKLTAKVPQSALGFEVLSPQGKVIDLGTEFGMQVTDEGATEVIVFDGKVEAHAGQSERPAALGVSLTKNQSARITDGKVVLAETADDANNPQFVRAIVPPPVITPRTLRLTFDGDRPQSLHDANGVGTGLTHRLPGTGARVAAQDPNLRIDSAAGLLALTTTRSDINRQVRLRDGEYLGIRLSDLGFTGREDFAVTATVPNTPALEDFGQFGLYAGTQSDRNIRGGFIKWGNRDPGYNTQFFVNNNGGADTDVHKVGLLSPGTDLRLTLRRTGGKYSLTVENLTDGGSSTLAIRHPEFLDGETDLFVGLFGANPYSDVRKTLMVKEFAVTVWTAGEPAENRG